MVVGRGKGPGRYGSGGGPGRTPPLTTKEGVIFCLVLDDLQRASDRLKRLGRCEEARSQIINAAHSVLLAARNEEAKRR